MHNINHNYWEIRNDKGEVLRHIEGEEAQMKPNGDLMIGTYGGEALPSFHRKILFDNPHQTEPNMANTGLDPKETKIMFTGSKEKCLQALYVINQAVINMNNQDLAYNGSQNGNTAAAEIFEKLQQMGLKMNHTPEAGSYFKGNFNLAYDGEAIDTPRAQLPEYENITDLIAQIREQEQVIAAQMRHVQQDPSADTNITVDNLMKPK